VIVFVQPKIWLILLLAIIPFCLSGKGSVDVDVDAEMQDTIQSLNPIEMNTPLLIPVDNTVNKTKERANVAVEIKEFKPDPVQAIWLGAVIPGYGQILNKKYWKLPIVYGGFLGCFFAINWNSKQFVSYKNAYLDITDGDDRTNSFLEIIPPGFTIESYGGQAAFTNLLKSGMDRSRYNRDLSIIVSIAYYGLTLIDAFVDAHLYDFDISPDLSLKLRPSIINDKFTTNQLSKSSFSYGLTGSIKF